jgi:multiple sugar transport system permease protein
VEAYGGMPGVTSVAAGFSARADRPLRPEAVWSVVLVIPYVAVFALFVVYPVAYGAYLGSSVASYVRLWNDPIFIRTVLNTIVFLVIGVNLKLALALLLSGFFTSTARWVRWINLVFVLPWAIPSLVTVLSFRWMLNAEWGMVNNIVFTLFGIDGPRWLIDPSLGLASIIYVHIWKWLPFWTLILLAARLTIPKDLYEAAAVDGASRLQQFRHVTFPGIWKVYVTSTLLSTIFTIGDFNSIYLLTGGGPADSTHVLATLGIRYAFGMSDVNTGVATVIVALPLMIPIIYVMVRRLKAGAS